MAIDVKSTTGPAASAASVPVVVSGGASAPAGNSPPPGGSSPPPAAVQAPDVSQAVAVLNRFLADSQRSFRFEVDDSTGETIVRIVNPETGELVRQIPSEEVLAGARALRAAGSLLNLRA